MDYFSLKYEILSKEPGIFDQDILPILDLQLQNHKNYLTADLVSKNGFVTLLSPPLQLRNQSVVCFRALTQYYLFGYIIGITDLEGIGSNRTLIELYNQLNHGRLFRETPWHQKMLVAQICVHESARGRGVAKNLYESMEIHARKIGKKFLFTEVDSSNNPSAHLHNSIGFTKLTSYQSSSDQSFDVLFKKL
jgi:GNAT superfamily N-acetyltransferase